MTIQELVKKVWPQWTVTKKIGEGSCGVVYKAEQQDVSGIYFAAIKHISIPKDQSELKAIEFEFSDNNSVSDYYRSIMEEIVNEFVLMKQLSDCPNIVNYLAHAVIPHVDDEGWDILIRMELLTSLPKYMKNHPMDHATVIDIGKDLCRALEACEKKKIIHRDIKPSNVLINEDGTFKLADFGVARTIEKTLSIMSKKGTNYYMAPEVYKRQKYDSTVDIYSLGIMYNSRSKMLSDKLNEFLIH